MRYLILIGTCLIFFQCKKDNLNVEYTNLGQGIAVTSLQDNCPTCSVQTGYSLDLNKDGQRDFGIIISHSFADSIYTQKNAYYIFISAENGNSEHPNNFSPRIATHDNSSVHSFFSEPLADLKDKGEEPHFDDTWGRYKAWIYKVDDYDSITVEGNHYVGLKLKDKKGNNYYGWVQLRIEFWKVTILDYAFCSSPNQVITCGKLE